MSNETYSFITTLEYVKFEFDDFYAVGYMIDLSRTRNGYGLVFKLYYSFAFTLCYWVFGVLLYFERKKI